MKRTIFLTIFLFTGGFLMSQVYNPVTYNYNGTPTYGVKIKTNLPFQNSSQMPTIIIEGYEYGGSKPIGLTLVYYIYGGNFYYPKVSSHGGYTPTIKLANEGGKVIIYIDEKKYFNRFSVRVFAKGMSAEVPENFEGWTIVDEPIGGTNQVTVPYENKFAGDVKLPGGKWNANGNVGIGTTSPGSGTSPDPDLKVQVNGGITLQSGKKLALDQNYYVHGYLQYDNSVSDGRLKYYGYYGHRWMTSSGEKMRLTRNGQLGIGTTDPDPAYKLSVNGKIRAEEVKVETGWADFIFDDDYKLRALSEIESFIKTNKHLPGIPTEKEVKEHGINLGEMNAKLLQKIEELTLYLIHYKKIQEEQARTVSELTKEIGILKTRITNLTTKSKQNE